MTIRKKQIVIDGLLSSYIDEGQGATVLLLHGWGGDAGIFKNVLQQLSKTYRVLAVDFPGFGQSDEPGSIWGVEDYAEWTAQLMRRMRVEEPVVIGHSFGGRVALVLSARIKIRKLMLTGSAGLTTPPRMGKKVEYRIAGALSACLENSSPRFFRWVRNVYIRCRGSRDYITSTSRMREILKKVIVQDLRDVALKVEVPTILIWGKDDKETPLSAGEEFARLIPNSKLEILADCGHYAFIDRKDEFLRIAKAFMKSDI